MKLVVWRRFLEVESPEYIDRYVTQHTTAPADEKPSAHLQWYFAEHDRPAVRIAWDDGWELTEFEGWAERASEHTGERA